MSHRKTRQDTDILHFDAYYANGSTIVASISNEGARQAAAGVNSLSASDISSMDGVRSTPTSFGLQAATVALGHTPSTVNDVYVKGRGNWEGIDSEYVQYDSLFVQVTYTYM